MAERTVLLDYVSWMTPAEGVGADGRPRRQHNTAAKGEIVDLPDAEVKRLEALTHDVGGEEFGAVGSAADFERHQAAETAEAEAIAGADLESLAEAQKPQRARRASKSTASDE